MCWHSPLALYSGDMFTLDLDLVCLFICPRLCLLSFIVRGDVCQQFSLVLVFVNSVNGLNLYIVFTASGHQELIFCCNHFCSSVWFCFLSYFTEDRNIFLNYLTRFFHFCVKWNFFYFKKIKYTQLVLQYLRCKKKKGSKNYVYNKALCVGKHISRTKIYIKTYIKFVGSCLSLVRIMHIHSFLYHFFFYPHLLLVGFSKGDNYDTWRSFWGGIPDGPEGQSDGWGNWIWAET